MPKKKQASNVIPNNALNTGAMMDFFDNVTEDDLASIKHRLTDTIYWWMGNPTEDRIKTLFRSFSFLDQFLDSNVILGRLAHLGYFKKDELGVHISKFMPELVQIRDESYRRFDMIPKSIRKAELWLLPFAQEAGADSNLEAAIYFKSRGSDDIIETATVRDRWYKAICHSILRGVPVATKITEDVLERAKQHIISLSEAASVCTFMDSIPTFFSYLDNEENFIDACFLRGLEWFNLQGFEPWADSLEAELISIPSGGVEPMSASWQLFFVCRATVALRKIQKVGWESALWSMVNGTVERSRPWRQAWSVKEFKIIDYIPIAASIVFAWQRIQPQNLDKKVHDECVGLLFQTQMPTGAWPIKSDDVSGSILSTCFAIHALAFAKPEGWKDACQHAKKWLLDVQEDVGCWHIDGGPTVMLTVLALDAINLSDGNFHVTFTPVEGQAATSEDVDLPDPVYDFSTEPWYDPVDPHFTTIAKNKAFESIKLKVAIIVATKVELKQALHVFRPLKGKKKILKVTLHSDTHYLGRFGKFDAVLTMSAMGSEGPSGATLTIDSIIKTWKPAAIFLIGIAFGASKRKHLPGDILVAEGIIPYENQRIGDTETIYRNPIPPASPFLLNRFRNAMHWSFHKPDGKQVSVHFGQVLSGSKLIDDLSYKKKLLQEFPNAIGGEMEGSGLYAAASRNKTEWILVKSVCDWADGKKHKEYQQLAAASAMSLCEYVLSDKYALDGIEV